MKNELTEYLRGFVEQGKVIYEYRSNRHSRTQRHNTETKLMAFDIDFIEMEWLC